MLTIRLSRIGKKKKPTFRVVISEKARDTQGTYLELLGNFNPQTKPATVNLNAERINFWLGRGASASPTVHNLLVSENIIKAKKKPLGRAKKQAADPAPAKVEAAPQAEPAK